jgi:hypothetical protein
MRGLAPDAFRATLSFTFAVSGTISMVMFVAAGLVARDEIVLTVAGVPVILLGQRAGLRLQPVFSGRRFDTLVYGLLLVSGVSVGVSGLLAG